MPANLRIVLLITFSILLTLFLSSHVNAQTPQVQCSISNATYNGSSHPLSQNIPLNTDFTLQVGCTSFPDGNPHDVTVTVGGQSKTYTGVTGGFLRDVGPFNFSSSIATGTIITITGLTASCPTNCSMIVGGTTPVPTTLPNPKSCLISPKQIDVGEELTVSPINFPSNATNAVSMIGAFGTPVISLGNLPNGGNLKVAIPTAPNGLYRVRIADGNSFAYCTDNLTVGEAGDGGIGQNPCEGGTCQTAVGPLPISIRGLADRLLQIGLGVAGAIALILIVVGAIRVLVSSGDPQKISGGREMIVAAVAGLIFLIFTTVILEFLGVNILGGVPGI